MPKEVESWEEAARQQQVDSEEWIRSYVKKYLEMSGVNTSKIGKIQKPKKKKNWRKLQKFVRKLVADARLIDAVWMTITYWGTHSVLVATHSTIIS